MSSLYTKEVVVVDAVAGTNINEAAKDAIELASFLDCTVTLKFNGSELFVNRRRTVDGIVYDFNNYRVNNGLSEVKSSP